MNNQSSKKSNRIIWIVAGLILALLAAFFVYRGQSNTANSSTTYQTTSANRGTLTASVGATGTVHAGQSVMLNWQTSGLVESVQTKIGDQVKAGQVLAALEQTSLPKSIILADADLISAKKSLADLMASHTSLAQAEQDLANAKQDVLDAQDKVDSLIYDRASDNLIQQTAAKIVIAKTDVAKAEDYYKKFKSKPDGDSTKATALLALTNARQNLNDLTIKYNWYTGKATNLDAEKYRAALALAKAKVDDAQREVERLKNGPSADDIVAAQANVAAAQATLVQSKITAPFNGVITMAEPQVGDLVSLNTTAFKVEDITRLYVDLQISEVDINGIVIGQGVIVTFDAVQGKTYNGKVAKVNQSADQASSAVNFTVTVELTDGDELIKPGMTAAITITVKEVKDALLVPNRAVRVVDGNRVVYVLKNGQAVATAIRLGSTSDSNSEVVGGDLKENDVIILNPPSDSNPGASASGNNPVGG